jgi:hypothetical protein
MMLFLLWYNTSKLLSQAIWEIPYGVPNVMELYKDLTQLIL